MKCKKAYSNFSNTIWIDIQLNDEIVYYIIIKLRNYFYQVWIFNIVTIPHYFFKVDTDVLYAIRLRTPSHKLESSITKPLWLATTNPWRIPRIEYPVFARHSLITICICLIGQYQSNGPTRSGSSNRRIPKSDKNSMSASL